MAKNPAGQNMLTNQNEYFLKKIRIFLRDLSDLRYAKTGFETGNYKL